MTGQYRFLCHSIFENNLKEFQEIASKSDLKSLNKQIEKCIADPLQAGKRIHPGGIDLNGGFVYRLEINGRDGYRLIYYANPKLKVVLGIYISTVPRKKFNYGKIEWESLAANLISDYISNKADSFSFFEPTISN